MPEIIYNMHFAIGQFVQMNPPQYLSSSRQLVPTNQLGIMGKCLKTFIGTYDFPCTLNRLVLQIGHSLIYLYASP